MNPLRVITDSSQQYSGSVDANTMILGQIGVGRLGQRIEIAHQRLELDIQRLNPPGQAAQRTLGGCHRLIQDARMEAGA